MNRTFKSLYYSYCLNEISEEDIVGLNEPIYIEDVGKVTAKIDSGNGAYNVLHGKILEKRGNYIIVQTVNDKKIKKEVVDKVLIHIGSGNKEERPVVEFNIIFDGKKLPGVRFSIADRSENEYPVLIGKQFIEDLGLLIDVSDDDDN